MAAGVTETPHRCPRHYFSISTLFVLRTTLHGESLSGVFSLYPASHGSLARYSFQIGEYCYWALQNS